MAAEGKYSIILHQHIRERERSQMCLLVVVKVLVLSFVFSIFPGLSGWQQSHSDGCDCESISWQLWGDAVHAALRRQSKEHRQPRRGQRRSQRPHHQGAARGSGEATSTADTGRGEIFQNVTRALCDSARLPRLHLLRSFSSLWRLRNWRIAWKNLRS